MRSSQYCQFDQIQPKWVESAALHWLAGYLKKGTFNNYLDRKDGRMVSQMTTSLKSMTFFYLLRFSTKGEWIVKKVKKVSR